MAYIKGMERKNEILIKEIEQLNILSFALWEGELEEASIIDISHAS